MVRFIIKNCNIIKIKDSGQCFRFLELFYDSFLFFSKDKVCKVRQLEDDIIVRCEDKDKSYWLYYFDEVVYGNKEVDYEEFRLKCCNDSNQFIRDSAKFSKGLRLLNQNPFECLISFIISQRKSIPAIRDCIEKLCSKYGDRLGLYETYDLYAFPTPEQLVEGYEKDGYKDCSLGYRAEYIYNTSREILNSDKECLECLRIFTYEESLAMLKKYKGVGDKVANCVLLYSLGFKNAFPKDVWINRIFELYFSDSDFPYDRYEGLLGVLQLYMFYYIRNKSI